MTLAGISRTGTGLWAAAVLLLLLCVSPLLHSFTININVVIAPNTQNLPRHAAAISIERRDTAAIPDARRGVAHTNPLNLTPHEPLLFEEPVEGSSPYLSRRSEGLSKRRDGALYCHDGPCIDNSCCGPDNVCGFGPDLCGEGCRSTRNATAMCGEHSEFAEMPCGMKSCCSASGCRPSLIDTMPTPCEARCPVRPDTVPATPQAPHRAPMAMAVQVAVNSESLVSPVSDVLLRARQNTYLICDVESRSAKCVTPRPNIPDPCIKVYMVYTMTTAKFQGIVYKAEQSINGKTVCKMETYCDRFAGSTDRCSGKKNYDCGNGNWVDSWTGERFLFYVKANDKVYDIQAKAQVFEGVWDACNGAAFACIPTVFRGKVGC